MFDCLLHQEEVANVQELLSLSRLPEESQVEPLGHGVEVGQVLLVGGDVHKRVRVDEALNVAEQAVYRHLRGLVLRLKVTCIQYTTAAGQYGRCFLSGGRA